MDLDDVLPVLVIAVPLLLCLGIYAIITLTVPPEVENGNGGEYEYVVPEEEELETSLNQTLVEEPKG